MCMIAVQNANLLNVQNDLLILRGSARVQQSQLLGRSLSSSCSGPSSCATQSFVHSSPPTAKSSSWLWCSCCATRWCRCWALAPPHSWRNSSWLSSPHQYSAASWGSRGAGWSLWPDRKCCSSRLAPCLDVHPGTWVWGPLLGLLQCAVEGEGLPLW